MVQMNVIHKGVSMKKLALVCGAVLAMTLALGATGGAFASAPAKHANHAAKKGNLVRGVVQAVSSDSITLTLKDGSTKTISVSAKTKIVVNGKKGSSLSDVQVGYRAYVALAKDGSARAIRSYDKADRKGIRGIAQAVGSDSITLELKDGSTKTINVTTATKIVVNGKPGSLSDIQVGYRTIVRLADDGSAKAIRSHEKADKSLLAHGVVDSVGSDSITLKLEDGSSVTIQVTAATKIRVAGKPGSLSDIQAGFRARVLRASADGPALAILARPAKA
jgi:hypothetical protein